MQINQLHYIFPIIGYKENKEGGKHTPTNIFGGAFSITNNFFITAAHVIDQASESDYYGINVSDKDGSYYILEIEFVEKAINMDIAIFKVRPKVGNPIIKQFLWNDKEINASNDVKTFGFPQSYNPTLKNYFIRSYKGYVTCSRKFNHSEFKETSWIFELSFVCPRGLSGSFLLDAKSKGIIGLVIGNTDTEIEISRESEVIERNGGKDLEYSIKSEITRIGIAMQFKSFKERQFLCLGGTLQEFLQRNELLINN